MTNVSLEVACWELLTDNWESYFGFGCNIVNQTKTKDSSSEQDSIKVFAD